MEGEDGSGDRILAAEEDKAGQEKVSQKSFRVVVSLFSSRFAGKMYLCQSESFIPEISSKSFSLFSVWIQKTISHTQKNQL